MINKKLSLFYYLLNLIDIVSQKNTVNKTTVNLFKKRIKEKKLIKNVNVSNHFCVFFLPIDVQNKKIYLCYHKKANDWIPPGGHIDENELPIQTVIRECKEELSIDINEDQIEFFNLSVKQVDNTNSNCKTHYDIWYLVNLKVQYIDFIKKEYFDAKWVLISEAKKYIKKNPEFLQVIEILGKQEQYPFIKK